MMKLRQRKSKKAETTETSTPSRITNETVAEHREQVLAGGRKFKYPVQYQKKKLIINTIIVGVATLVLVSLLGWHQLYIAQNTSKLMYRITQILPVPVATVDGEAVKYSDYLMRYRSSMYYLQQQNDVSTNTNDGRRQAEFVKRQELDRAEMMTYVRKLAREKNLKVLNKEVDDFIKSDVDARAVSLNAYEKTVLKSFYDWSLDEYKIVVRDELLKRKVSFAVDAEAKKKIEDLHALVKNGADIAVVAADNSDDTVTKSSGGDSGNLTIHSQDPNGLVAAARRLDKDQLSEIIKGVDGYYFLKLINKDAASVQYRVVKIGLKALDAKFDSLKKDGKINEFIRIQEMEV